MLTAPTKHHKMHEQVPSKLPSLTSIPPLFDNSSDDVLLRLDGNKLDVYTRSELTQHSPKPRTLVFVGDLFKKFSAYCCARPDKCLIFGGSQPNNPNIKSKEVICLDLVSGEGSVVC